MLIKNTAIYIHAVFAVLRSLVDAPTHLKEGLLFSRRGHGCCRVLSCHSSGSLNVTGLGARRCFLPASPERNLTEESHKTSFKEQAEIACLSSGASLSHPATHLPTQPPTLPPPCWSPLLLNPHQMEAHEQGMATLASQSLEGLHGRLHLVDSVGGGGGGTLPVAQPSSL